MLQYLYIGLCLVPSFLLSQAPTTAPRNPLLVGMRGHYGFIIPHSRDIAGVSGSNPFGVEMNVQWVETREERLRNTGVVAKRGFVAHHINYDFPEVLGSCTSLAAYVEPLIRPDRRLYGSVQMALGASYMSKVYDAETNPTNLFFSTPVSFLVMTNAYLNYKLTPQWEVSLGFNYNHISNGGMRTPNKGMNFPTWNAGAAYNFRPAPIRRAPKSPDWKNEPRHFYYIQAVGSLKTVEANEFFAENKLRWLLGGIAVAGRRVGRMSALSAGTEWIHDGWKRAQLDRWNDPRSALLGGMLAGHELLSGRVRFTTHLGIYVHNPARTTDLLYQRYGLFYRIGKHLLVGATLKSHRHIADVFDVRMGWVW
jgi:hypothetical protein